MQVREMYDQWSPDYDSQPNKTRDLDARVVAEWLASDFVRRARGGTVVELGCGTGKNTAPLSRAFARVLAIDFSPGMLRRARERVAAPHVAFLRADISSALPCGDRTAVAVVIDLVLEHIEHPAPVFAEVARVLAPGGRLLLSELHPFRQYGGSVARYADPGDGILAEIPAFVHHLFEFVAALRAHDFAIEAIAEWWHPSDAPIAPRLLSIEAVRGEQHENHVER